MESFIRVFCVFLLLGSAVSSESGGCPTLSVSPCTCTDSPLPVLTCDKVTQTVDLRIVFLNSAGTKYNVVRLTNSVLQYLPHELFERVEVQELQLINGTFVQLFDKAPKNVTTLRTLHIENVRFLRPIKWELLEPMTNLRILDVYSTRIEDLGDKFARYAPRSLEQISFYDIGTVKITSGVFGHFPNLDKVTIDHTLSRGLKRNIFPVPFNGRFLNFNGNRLTSLPVDMFSDMPTLQSVSLRGNFLTTLPPYPFENLQYLDLEGNPLNCDCDLAWIAKESLALKGTCSSPPALHGRDLEDAYKTMTCL